MTVISNLKIRQHPAELMGMSIQRTNFIINLNLFKMKKLGNSIFVMLFIVALFASSGCGLIDSSMSPCDGEENLIDPVEKRSFKLHCVVEWEDGTLADGLYVKYQIRKNYCDGHSAGIQMVKNVGVTALTNGFGAWKSYYVMTYDFGNKKDRVLVTFYIANYEFDYVYRWEDVEGGDVEEWKTIILPINEDGSK